MTFKTINHDTGEITNAVSTPFFRTPYNYDTNLAGDESGINCKTIKWTDLDGNEKTGDPGYTQQSARDETDINNLVKAFAVTGQMPMVQNPPSYDDFTGITDYQTALNAVNDAKQAFMQYPAETRERFNNDPQKLMAFLADGRNHTEALKLGLINQPPERARDETVLPSAAAQPAPKGTTP